MGHGVSCIQYPESGREAEFGARVPVDAVKRIAVVGGGPGGMKAAAVAAERGHKVTLFEKSGRLGGQALLAQALPGRDEFGGLVTNLEREMLRHGVDVVKNTEVTGSTVLAGEFDAVVVATGATPRVPDGVFEGAHVVTAWDVIANRANVGQSVVVADWRCDWIGPGIAELLATQGCSVRLCVNGEMMGAALQSFVRADYAGRLHELGVTVTPYMRLFDADDDTVYCQHAITGEAVQFEAAETLVLAYGHDSVTDLYAALEGRVEHLYAVGDCLSPRTAEEAILEGLKVAAAI
jgi:pyruvate/2-oxoglutarate dehydrogenase complex dihydrolipoamide dehydrogenase (E3) component